MILKLYFPVYKYTLIKKVEESEKTDIYILNFK